MSLLVRIYYNAVYGALGGLVAWLLLGVFLKSLNIDPPHVETENVGKSIIKEYVPLVLFGMFEGMLIGGSIGFFVVSVDAIRDQSLVRFNRLATYGLIIGAIGGAIALPLAEIVHSTFLEWIGATTGVTGFQRVLRILLTVLLFGVCWALVGAGVGVSEGIAARSMGKLSYGAVGGAIGGFIGGAIHSFLLLPSEGQQVSLEGQRVVTGIGLVIVGACIGSLSALVQGVMQPACVKVLRGWQEGREYPLIKVDNLLGREEHADIALFRDMKVEKKHAVIRRVGDRFYLYNNNAPPEFTLVNEEKVRQSVELKEGDKIQLGNVVLRFHARAAVNKRPVKGGYQRPV